MSNAPLYAGFLGSWVLIPESCDYQQGEPPQSGHYRIDDGGGRLTFHMEWTDATGAAKRASFSGNADGGKETFPGGERADELEIRAVSERELNSYAYWQGNERMVAQRQLDDSGMAMRITQVVRFPDGTQLANVSVYRKLVRN